MRLCLSLILLGWTTLVGAQTSTPVNLGTQTNLVINGVVYKNARIQKRNAAEITIFHSTGVATVPMEQLSDEMRKDLGYDPKLAEQYRQQEAARLEAVRLDNQLRQERRQQQQLAEAEAEREQALREELVKNAKPVNGKITQVVSDGLLVERTIVFPTGDMEYRTLLLVGHPNQDSFVDGNYVACNAALQGKYTFVTVMGAPRTVERWVYVSEYQSPPPKSNTDAFGRPIQQDPNYRAIGEQPR